MVLFVEGVFGDDNCVPGMSSEWIRDVLQQCVTFWRFVGILFKNTFNTVCFTGDRRHEMCSSTVCVTKLLNSFIFFQTSIFVVLICERYK